MITDLKVPTIEDLKPLINEALESGFIEPNEFIKAHTKGVMDNLKSHPENYRNYGFYWWAVKAILINNGYELSFPAEPEMEAVTRDHFTIDNDEVATLCAAWVYSDSMARGGRHKNAIHTYEADNGYGDFDEEEYSIEDMDMERLIK